MIDYELFWSLVDRRGPDECWLWKAGKSGGYGEFWVPKLKRNRGAHRIAFELWWGVTLLRRLHVCHNCPGGDNPACCNPAHLLIGDNKWHGMDRAAKGQMPRGNLNGTHTHPEQVRRGDQHHARMHPELMPQGDDHWMRRMPERILRGEDHWNHKKPERRAFGQRNGAYTKPEKVRRGETNGMSVLTWARVGYIRQKHACGTVSQTWLANLLGVTPTTICSVLKERIWKPDQQPSDGP